MARRATKPEGIARVRERLRWLDLNPYDPEATEDSLWELDSEVPDLKACLAAIYEERFEKEGDPLYEDVRLAVVAYERMYGDEAESRAIGKAIADLIFKRGLTDAQRMRPYVLATNLGVRLDPRRMREVFDDFDGCQRRSAVEAGDYDRIASFQEDLPHLGPRYVAEIARESSGRPGRAAAFALAFLAEHPNLDVARIAIDGLGRSREPVARWFLGGMSQYAWRCVPEIDQALVRIRARRVPCPSIPTPRNFKIRAALPDGRGSLSVYLSSRNKSGSYLIVSVLFNDLVGVKDCYGDDILPADRHREMAEKNRRTLPDFPIDREVFGRLFRHGLWTARENKKTLSMEFAARRVRLGDLALEPARFVPDLSAYPPVSGDLLKGTEKLLDEHPYSQWWYQSPASYAFVGKLDLEGRRRPGDAEIDAFARAFYSPDRGRLTDRLAWTLDLCANHLGEPAPKEAFRLYRALLDERIPLERIPFFRRASEMSIQYTDGNLRAGFTKVRDYTEEAFIP